MKILKKFLLIGLFSFAFVVNANAEEMNFQYDERVYNFLENYSILNKNIINYFKENAVSIDARHTNGYVDIVNDKNVLMYDLIFSQLSNGTINVGILANYNYENTNNYFFINSTPYFTVYYYKYTFSFNIETQEIIELTSAKTSLVSSQFSSLNGSIKNYFTWELGKNTETILINESEYDYIINSNNQVFSANSTYMGTFYNFVETINYGLVEDDYNYLDYYENSEVITYKIKDDEIGKDKELNIRFTFPEQLNISFDNITIYKYGSQVATLHNMTCTNIETSSVCEFNLKYDVNENIDDKIMFDFKFDDKYNVKIEDTSGSNGIYSNYKDVEYEYKQLNFREKSGAVFYLRNYDNYEYLSSFYEDDYFKFIIMSDTGILGKNKIYPNDILYNNTFIDKNINFLIDNNNLININNFGRIEIPFIFNSDLLLENKFSSFVLLNRNYLGNFDNENLNLYLYYNSSLFNINYLKYSNVIKDDGSIVEYVSPSNNFDFTYNSKQESTPPDINSGFEFEFDKDIKVSYNNGFEYFKDKIIDVFELVSEFFNTMPQKFKIAFSFIFVLLIGIVLFRLLL